MERASYFSGAYTLAPDNAYTVNGTAYEIELEELTGAVPAASAVPAAPAAPRPQWRGPR